MEHTTAPQSVWGTSTDDFKQRFRQYLAELKQLQDDSDRSQLIQRLEWCFDRWNHWRERFFPKTDNPLIFPFFQSSRGGQELGHYSTVGASGQPSVIHLKRALLLGTADVVLMKGKTQSVVLMKDHPDRDLIVDRIILHELVHQYLHEGADAATIRQYETQESGRRNHKGHGSLFARECNRINEKLHPEVGMEFVPVRHMRSDRGPLEDRQRPSCAHFGFGELLYCWSPEPGKNVEPLTPEQIADNERRLQQAMEWCGALKLVKEAEKVETDFLAPFSIDCADTCHQQLAAHDQGNQTTLVADFHLATLKQMQAAGTLDQLLQAVGHSAAVLNIPPANGKNGNGSAPAVAIPESGPTVPAGGGGELGVAPGDWVRHDAYGLCRVEIADPDGTLFVSRGDSTEWRREVSDADVVPAKPPTVSSAGDNERQTLKTVYPISDPVASLKRLNADIEAAGGKAALCQQQFGLKDGSTLSRHLKALQHEIEALVAA